MHVSKLLLFALLITGTRSLLADSLMLKGGDQISGKIEKVQEGFIYFTTSYAGTLKIKTVDVLHIKSNESVMIRTDPKVEDDKRKATMGSDDQGNLTFQDQHGQVLKMSDISTVWDPAGQDPDFPPIKPWTFSVSLGINGSQTGSQEARGGNIYCNATHKSENTTLAINAAANYAETTYSNGFRQKTSDDRYLGLDYEWQPTEYSSWYARNIVSRNRLISVALRNSAAAGYGVYVWNRKKGGDLVTLLRLRAGFAHVYTSYLDGNEEENHISLDLGLLFQYNFECGIQWKTNISLQPKVGDFAQYYLAHESTLGIKLNLLNMGLSEEAGIRHEVSKTEDADSDPSTYWFFRIKRSW